MDCRHAYGPRRAERAASANLGQSVVMPQFDRGGGGGKTKKASAKNKSDARKR